MSSEIRCSILYPQGWDGLSVIPVVRLLAYFLDSRLFDGQWAAAAFHYIFCSAP
jgi:hypothetical protein